METDPLSQAFKAKKHKPGEVIVEEVITVDHRGKSGYRASRTNGVAPVRKVDAGYNANGVFRIGSLFGKGNIGVVDGSSTGQESDETKTN